MKPNTRFRLSLIVVAVATSLAASTISFPSLAASRYQDTESVTHYSGWEDPVMANIAVNSGRALLQHLQSAKAWLDTGNVGDARSTLIATADFADALERMMPYVVVVDDITNAKHKLADENIDVFYDDLLPIYASLDEMSMYAPKVAKKTRGKLKQAEKQAHKGDRKSAAKIMQDVADDITVTKVYLPVNFVDGQVSAALNALKKNPPDLPSAKKAVNNALDSLTGVVDSVELTPRH